MKETYIENCFCLTPKRVDQSLNRFGRRIGDNSDLERKDIKYNYKQIGENYFIDVNVVGHQKQRILTETISNSFGWRDYFHCDRCDSRCNKLFLLPGGHIFRCKDCHGIKYQNFSSTSKQGKIFTRARKILKLVNKQANMTSRIWYRSAYTKRYAKFLNDCLEVGLTDVVEEARALEDIIKRSTEE